MKACTRCGDTFPYMMRYFYVSGRCKNGDPKLSWCKSCVRAYNREHQRNRRAKYPKRVREQQKRSRGKHSESRKEACRRWHSAHKDAVHAYNVAHKEARYAYTAKWRATHKEAVHAYHTAWRAAHKELVRAHSAKARGNRKEYMRAYLSVYGPKYRAAHKDADHARQARWRAAHKEARRITDAEWRRTHPLQLRVKLVNRRARIRNAVGHHTVADISRLFDEQGGRCFYCTAILTTGWHVDHKTPLVRDGANDPANLACTCKSCNLRKNTKTESEFFQQLGKGVA